MGGWFGINEKENKTMQHDFHYISKKNSEVQKAYRDILNILKDTQNLLRQDFSFRFNVIGSYKRNMITYDKKSNIGYDFDFNIEVNDNRLKPKELKNMLQNAIGKVCVKYGYDTPEDSTRVLTIKKKNRRNSCIIHSCDFAIVNTYTDDENKSHQEYIHFNKATGSYTWCEQAMSFYMLTKKINWIKKNSLQNDMRKLYLKKKNNNDDPNVHSRSIFAQTVQEVCQKYGFFKDNSIDTSTSFHHMWCPTPISYSPTKGTNLFRNLYQ